MTKRVAICFYGQPRLVEKGYNAISKFIKNNHNCDIDIFVHTWWDDKLIGQLYKTSPWRNISQDELTIKENTIQTIVELYNPKCIVYESPKTFQNEIDEIRQLSIYKNDKDSFQSNIYNTLSNLYSKYAVSILLKTYMSKHNIQYDTVISTRFDILNDIYLDINKLDINKIYCRNVRPRFYFADCFIVFTNMDLFLKYSMTFVNIKKINDSCGQFSKDMLILFSVNLEELLTLNMALYYETNEYIDMVIFTNDIPNFV